MSSKFHLKKGTIVALTISGFMQYYLVYSVQEMELIKSVLGIKDYYNNTDQESRQAHSAKRRKLLSELWKKKSNLKQ